MSVDTKMPLTRASSKSVSSRSKHQATPSISSTSSIAGGIQLTPSASDTDTLSLTSEDVKPKPTGSIPGTSTSARSPVTLVPDNLGYDGEDDTASTTSRRSVLKVTDKSSASSDTLTSIFEKLSVDDKRKALDALQNKTATQPATKKKIGPSIHQFAPSLEDWQDLCRACSIKDEDMPPSIKQCKKVCTTFSINTAACRLLLTGKAGSQEEERESVRFVRCPRKRHNCHAIPHIAPTPQVNLRDGEDDAQAQGEGGQAPESHAA